MNEIMLYRGDTILNQTMPERYRSCGIISKMINGGNPAYVQRNGLVKSIQAHINPLTEAERIFLSKSKFISFSEEKFIAKKHCLYDKVQNKYLSDELIECEDYHETRYVFSLDISEWLPLSPEEGIFLLEYNCNPARRKSDGLNEDVIEFQVESEWYQCEVCKRNEKHKMYIVDCVKFLECHKKYCLNEGAFLNAKEDKEWLVLPRDFHKDLRGCSSMIPVSNIWKAELYFLKSKGMRNSYQFTIQGTIIE